MAHFAQLNAKNVVERVLVINDNDATTEEEGVTFIHGLVGSNETWKQTSYNTRGGVHINGGTPFRKNFAGIGYKYDADKDAFIPPQKFSSWTLNETTCLWEPPIAKPDDGNQYYWDEEAYQSDNTEGWVLIE